MTSLRRPFTLDQNDPVDMPESHFGNRPQGRRKGGRMKLQSLTICAENIRAADRDRTGPSGPHLVTDRVGRVTVAEVRAASGLITS